MALPIRSDRPRVSANPPLGHCGVIIGRSSPRIPLHRSLCQTSNPSRNASSSLVNMGRLFQPRGALLQVMITISCSSGFFLFGYDQGVFSGVIVTPYFLETFNNPEAGLLGTINAIYDIGAAVGALICLFFGDALGRKKTIAMGIIFATVGAVLQGTAESVGHLIAGRKFNCTPLHRQ